MEQYTKQTKSVEESIPLQSMRYKPVVTPNGSILGKVIQIRIQDGTCHLEGLVIKKLFKKKFFVSSDYIKHISLDAIMLTEEIANQYINVEVITYDGEKFGRVVEVHRVQNTNKIESLTVKRRGILKRKVTIPLNDIHQIGASIILKENAK